ncbi:hypothetical protein J6590_002052 [Homalodisca vitripennis]|nr:hypothetical protein J6590_002052 [Homalodisca vitripennis]
MKEKMETKSRPLHRSSEDHEQRRTRSLAMINTTYRHTDRQSQRLSRRTCSVQMWWVGRVVRLDHLEWVLTNYADLEYITLAPAILIWKKTPTTSLRSLLRYQLKSAEHKSLRKVQRNVPCS